MTNLQASLQAGLNFVRAQQRTDGGFDGLASANPTDFQDTHFHPTIFFTALIAQCCNHITGGNVVSAAAAPYLLRHKSAGWSWNYWQRDADGTRMRGYPDDLDDTACALAALVSYDSTVLDGAVMGFIGQQLVASETAIGGPYETWLVPKKDLDVWHDVDVAVNANIACMLSQLSVQLPGMEQFLLQSLTNGLLTSSYYIGTIPTLYFMARIRSDVYREGIQAQLTSLLATTPTSRPSLMNAMLLATACRVGYNWQQLQPIVRRLQATQRDDHWAASALYVEPPLNGQQYYAGSDALTTAFVCEALSLFTAESASVTRQPVSQSIPTPAAVQAAEEFAQNIKASPLRTSYASALDGLVKRDRDGQISGLAARLCHDSGADLDDTTLCQLDVASINGWMAYTLYDAILDDEFAAADQLSTANVALRECVRRFHQALPTDLAFQKHVEQVLLVVDAANAWERSHSRARRHGRRIRIAQLPDYADHAKLVERSWGHVLATTGVLCAQGYALDSAEIDHWHTFFYHFIMARQLHDDAHDWQDDLKAGHLSAVVSLLLAGRTFPLTIDLTAELPDLRVRFWEITAETVADMITESLDKAEQALQHCDFLKQPDHYYQLIKHLRRGVEQMRTGRADALAFIQSFSGEAVVSTV